MAKVMSFLVKLKKLPMEHLTQYMSDKQNRNKIWRTIESSRNQKKVARKGIAMGIGVGVEYDRILELHGKGITYTHEDGTLPKTISFHDVRYVGAVGGGRSSRWKIVMKDEKQPCYEFAADTVKARDAWVWCVRNNLHTFTRKNNLDDVLASPNAKTLHNAFSVSNAAVAHDIRPMETMGKLTEENEGTSSFSKPQARHWTA